LYHYGGRQSTPSIAPYYNGYSLQYISLPQINWTNPYGIDPLSGLPIWNYNIVRNNYLQDVKYVWWSVSGPVTQYEHSILTYFGYPNNGSVFDFTVSDYSTSPGPQWVNTSQQEGPFYFGIIKESLTPGKKIGYICIQGFDFGDYFLFMLDPAFRPANATGTYNPIKMFGVVNAYLKSQGVNELIIDVRANYGGIVDEIVAFASMFGDNRTGVKTYLVPIGDNSQVATLNRTIDLNVDVSEDIAGPDGVFRTGPVDPLTINLITSTEIYGESPLILYLMNGSIGSSCTVLNRGNVDGRYHGSNSLSDAPPYNSVGPKVYFGGEPFPIFTYSRDIITPYMLNTLVPSTWFSQPLKPSKPFDHSWNVFYRDVGLLPPSGGPNPEDPTTWTDTWLDKIIKG
jgi:hypothetical protein